MWSTVRGHGRKTFACVPPPFSNPWSATEACHWRCMLCSLITFPCLTKYRSNIWPTLFTFCKHWLYSSMDKWIWHISWCCWSSRMTFIWYILNHLSFFDMLTFYVHFSCLEPGWTEVLQWMWILPACVAGVVDDSHLEALLKSCFNLAYSVHVTSDVILFCLLMFLGTGNHARRFTEATQAGEWISGNMRIFWSYLMIL